MVRWWSAIGMTECESMALTMWVVLFRTCGEDRSVFPCDVSLDLDCGGVAVHER